MLERVLALQEAQQLPKATLVMADPPWVYSDGTRGQSKRRQRGLASGQYDGLGMESIWGHLKQAHQVAALDSYLQVWCTFPKLEEWMQWSSQLLNCWPNNHPNEQRGWRYVSGGSWHKTGMSSGVGYHFRGNAELLLLYTRGHPEARTEASNSWTAPRGGHSEKPQLALRRLVDMACKHGDLVIDLYSGSRASLARACRAMGRSYIGAELDPVRHREALQAFGAQELELEGSYPLERPKELPLRLMLPVSEDESRWADLSPEQAKRLRKTGHL
jgi:N6-adenosine-specific RNA methylase IME4